MAPDTPPAAGERTPRRPRSHRLRRVAITFVGVVLLWGALALCGYAVGWNTHKSHAQSSLLDGARRLAKQVARHDPATPCVVTASKPGQLAGVLHIPALHLTAPVEEGTTDSSLNVAVGHDATSVWPGQAGTSVLLAHDVSYFVHLDQLQPGDTIDYETACTTSTYTVSGSQVVEQGAPVPGSSTPTLVLDTCYPPNALFFTSKRLLVTAAESKTTTTNRPTTHTVSADDPTYSVPVPAALAAQGLTLQDNEVPMGTMSLSGQTTPGWEQSPGPLALEAAALEAYFGGVHSAEQGQAAWWAAIAQPGVGVPAPLEGATLAYDTSLDVAITSTGGRPSSVTLTTRVTVSGGSAPGPYAETVVLALDGSTVTVGSWTLDP